MAEHDARKLLDFIIHGQPASLEEKQAEYAPRAGDPADPPEIMAGHEVQTEAEAAQRLFPAFAAGLRAAAASRTTGQALMLDDADPAQNGLADALIRFLVKSHLATVETQEEAPDHYRYLVTVDWPGMERTATLAGVDLNAALSA